MKSFSGMNKLGLSTRWLMVALMWLGAMWAASGADVRGYGVFKAIDYVQSSTNAPVLQANWPAYSFSAIVQPTGLFSNQVVSASVESPSGLEQLTPPVANTDQPFASYFGALTQNSLDASYPTGVYVLRINTAHDGNKVLSLNLTNVSATAFPTNAPRVANFNQAQTIDTFTNFVMTWDAFAGGTTNDFISISIADTNGVVVFRSATFGTEAGLTLLNGTNTSILIASNKLAWGQAYSGYIYFEKDPVIQTTDYPGARGLIGFAKATSFPLQTRPVVVPTLTTLSATNNRFVLRLSGDPGKSYIIQASTNLSSGSWTPVVTNVANGGSFDYTNVNMGNFNSRFFRALFKP